VLVAGNLELDSTGVILSDSSPNRRVEIGSAGNSGRVFFYSGDGSETVPGSVHQFNGGREVMYVIAPEIGAGGGSLNAEVNLFGRTAALPSENHIMADQVNIDLGDGDLIITGGQVQLPNTGGVGAPDLTFQSDLTTGMYRPAASTIGFALAGADIMRMTTTNVETYKAVLSIDTADVGLTLRDSNATLHSDVTKQIRFERSDGTASGFIQMQTGNMILDTQIAGQDLLLREAGNTKVRIDSEGAAFFAGTESNPGIYWLDDFNSGLWWASSDVWHGVAGGDVTFTVNTGEFIVGAGDTTKLRVQDGTEALPAITSDNDDDTGIWWEAANELTLVTGASARLKVQANGVRTVDGVQATPAYSFINDTDSGMWLDATGILGFGVANSQKFIINTTSVQAQELFYQLSTDEAGVRIRQTTVDTTPTKYIRFEQSTGAQVGNVGMVGGDMRIGAEGTGNLIFRAGAANAWQINQSTGDLRPVSAGAGDVGTATNYGGTIHASLTDSTTNANAMNKNSSTHRLQFDSSAIRNKQNVTPWVPTRARSVGVADGPVDVDTGQHLVPHTKTGGADGFVDGLRRIAPHTYLHGFDENPDVGLIADHIEIEFPEVVVYDENLAVANYREKSMIAVLVGAIRELDQRLTDASL
jgi:hypothetical protein